MTASSATQHTITQAIAIDSVSETTRPDVGYDQARWKNSTKLPYIIAVMSFEE
jgi:hypothetical protein